MFATLFLVVAVAGVARAARQDDEPETAVIATGPEEEPVDAAEALPPGAGGRLGGTLGSSTALYDLLHDSTTPPVDPSAPATRIATAAAVAGDAVLAQRAAEAEAARAAAEQEAARQEAERQEAERQEAQRQEAQQLAAQAEAEVEQPPATTAAPVPSSPPPAAPPATAPPTTAPAPPPPPPQPGWPADATWDQLAQCESGGNWAINSGNGYFGGLQFSLSTWQGVGGSGYPHENSREEQIHRANVLWSSSGFGPWPSCKRKLGL